MRKLYLLATILALVLGLSLHAAQLTVNIGTTANDGTGDTLRSAFGKVNTNFAELYSISVTNALAAATIVVDGTYGSDTTGTRGRTDKPFATWDVAMTNAQAGDFIFIRPGTYTTAGIYYKNSAWHGTKIPTGVTILGSGPGNTTLRLLQTYTNTLHIVLGSDYDGVSSNIYVGNLTLDGGATNLWYADYGKVNGLSLPGSDITVENVNIENYRGATNGTVALESFGIYVGKGSRINVRNCRLHTRVTGFDNSNNTGIIVATGVDVTIRDCYVRSWGIGYGMSGYNRNVAFINCTGVDVTKGWNCDTDMYDWGCRIEGAFVTATAGASQGVHWEATASTNLVIMDSYFDNVVCGFWLTNDTDGYFQNVRIVNNFVSGDTAYRISYATNVMISANRFETGLGVTNDVSTLWGGGNRHTAAIRNYGPWAYEVGSLTEPSITLLDDQDSGISWYIEEYPKRMFVGFDDQPAAAIQETGILVQSTNYFGFWSDAARTNRDVWIERNAAGVLSVAQFTNDAGSGSLMASNLTLSGSATFSGLGSGTPTDSTNPVVWKQFTIDGTNLYLPLYQ